MKKELKNKLLAIKVEINSNYSTNSVYYNDLYDKYNIIRDKYYSLSYITDKRMNFINKIFKNV